MHKQLRIFLGMESFFVFSLGMFGPIYAIFVQKVGGSILDAGFASSLFMIVSGCGILVSGYFSDKIKSYKTMILIGYSIISMCYLGYSFLTEVWQLYAIQVLLGIASIIAMPSVYAFYSIHVKDGQRAWDFSQWEGIWRIFNGCGAIIGAGLVSFFGFKALFLTMFAFTLIGLVVGITIKNEHYTAH